MEMITGLAVKAVSKLRESIDFLLSPGMVWNFVKFETDDIPSIKLNYLCSQVVYT